MGLKPLYGTQPKIPISLALGIERLAGKAWDRGPNWSPYILRQRAACPLAEVTVTFIKREHPRSLGEFPIPCPINDPQETMPCFIVDSQSFQTLAWRIPPARLTHSSPD